MKIERLLSIFTIVATILLTACSKSDDPVPDPDSPDFNGTANRTVLVYMAANNSLGQKYYDSKDIEEMKEAVLKGALGKNNRLIIFWANYQEGTQKLYEMLSDGTLKMIREYSSDLLSVHAGRMYEVFEDTKSLAPAHDYGLIMWSHALGWTQDGVNDDTSLPKMKTWGEHSGRRMNITTLKRVLEASTWSWIYFDCCFMGSVEVAYELSPVVDLMVASATEVPLDGMPYDKNLPLFFTPEPDLVGAARNTFNYYDNLGGSERTCTITVFDLRKIKALADATVPIYKAARTVFSSSFDCLPLETSASPDYYDFGVYIDSLCKANGIDGSLLAAWKDAYSNSMLYHAATPKLWNYIDLKAFTGMSTFIMRTSSQQGVLNYDSLAWYQDVAYLLYNK